MFCSTVAETEERCFWLLLPSNKVLQNLLTYSNHFILHKYHHTFFLHPQFYFFSSFQFSLTVLPKPIRLLLLTSSTPSSFCLLLCSKSNVTCFRWHPTFGPLWIKMLCICIYKFILFVQWPHLYVAICICMWLHSLVYVHIQIFICIYKYMHIQMRMLFF